MDIEQEKQKLDQIGQTLLGPGGFFEHMPEDQNEMFGDAIKIMGKIAAIEVIQEHMGGGFEINLNLPSINLGNLFSINPKPAYKEEYYNEPYNGCGACGSDPCMCNQQPPMGEPNIEMSEVDYITLKENCELDSTGYLCKELFEGRININTSRSNLDEAYIDPAMMENVTTTRSNLDEYVEKPMSGDTA